MAKLNVYSLYNPVAFLDFDKSIEFLKKVTKTSYDNVLSLIEEKDGIVVNDVKIIEYPEVDKSIKIHLDKNSEIIELEVTKNDKVIQFITVQKC